MQFKIENGALVCHRQGETLRIEAWGQDSLRVRSTMFPAFSGQDWALTETVPADIATVEMGEQELREGDGSYRKYPIATVTNGRLSVTVNHGGVMTFYRDGKRILRDLNRIRSLTALTHTMRR